MVFPRLKAVSDHAVLVEFGDKIDDATHAKVVALDNALSGHPPAEMTEVVPAYVNILVAFNPLQTDHSAIMAAVKPLIDTLEIVATAPRTHEVCVCYDDDLAPDLNAVAKQTGMSTEAVINAHLSGQYSVAMYGFAPGYAYMSGVPKQIQLPRKASPVRGVAAGSVIIAAAQCLVTTINMPAGWWNIGRSATKILLDDSDRPFLFDVNDTVKFRRIDRTDFMKMVEQS